MRKHKELTAQKTVATFMSAATPMETYLMRGSPLTDIEIDLIATTVFGLQSALKVWKRKNGIPAGLASGK